MRLLQASLRPADVEPVDGTGLAPSGTDMQLNLKTFFERTEQYFPRNEVVTRRADGSISRYRYADYCARARRMADAIGRLGIQRGDRVATLGWNTDRHLELYSAVPCFGAILHTINIRLGDDDVAFIIDKAQDRALFVDAEFLPLVERIAPRLPSLQHIIVMGAAEDAASTSLPVLRYETLIETGDPVFAFPDLDENSLCGMCFTSATTGRPKGVVYSQRSLYLHSMALCMADVMGLAERDTLLPVVPMFHANTWGLPYAALAVGAKMVLPGPQPTPSDILDLIEQEQVNFCAAAVTVGVQMYAALRERPRNISSLRQLMLGGSATPRALMQRFQERYGVPVFTAWGSTECAPLATITHVPRDLLDAGHEARMDVRVRQGIPVPGVEMKVLDESGAHVSRDDQTPGEVYVRGPWIAESYYQDERSKDGFSDGWWKSGDIATLNQEGALRLVDRAKDLIKSGGEWISSVDLENELMACPGVAEAAVIAAPHERWQERPVAYVVRSTTATPVSEDELRNWLTQRFVKWWLPDHYLFVAAIPKTGVGKINKRELRERVLQDIAR